MNQFSISGTGRKSLLIAILLVGMSPSLSGHVNAPSDGDGYNLATYCPGERSPACQDHDSSPTRSSPETGTTGPTDPEPPGPAEPTDPTTPG